MGWENNVWLPLGNPGEGAQGQVKHQAQTDKASPLTSTRWALDGLVDWKAGPARDCQARVSLRSSQKLL